MTLVQDGDFAVEVALLSRNVVVEGNTNLQGGGGHFWIMHTPSVVQTIEGVLIENFGIQGTLGRYPIHFHHCANSESIVAKNTIRQSHQRCVVVHGTNKVLVQDNVAYDHAGHCFVLEDGIETGNFFVNNLGAMTSAPAILIESGENEPATFWLTNPTNTLQGNVAAGSVGSGIWYELRKQGPLADSFPNPMHQPLTLFENNVVHSNQGRFAVRLYPTGFLPNGNTQIASGLKSYRNAGTGIFIHKVHKFALTEAVFADNDFSIDLERAESINVTNTTIIGMSDSYLALMGREENTEKICNSVRNKVIGIDLQSWRLRNVEGGYDIRDVDIVGFHGLDCGAANPIHMDILSTKQARAELSSTRETKDSACRFCCSCSQKNPFCDAHTHLLMLPFAITQGAFEVPTTFSDMNVTEGRAIDFCDAQNWGIDFFLSDLDGTLSPATNPIAGPGVLVTNGPKMTTFVDPTNCVEIPEGCYQDCRDTCLQSINFEVNTAESENYTLKVCKRNNPALCIEVSGSQRYNPNNPYGDYPRSFFVHLPPGDYDAVFLDVFGAETLPGFVRRLDEGLQCAGSPVDVAVKVPPTAPGYCSELIKNGNAEESASEPTFWRSANGGMEVVQGAGVNGTNALAATRFGFGSKILQYLDTRCFTEGAEFSVTAKVKLLTEAGEISICDPTTDRCPYLRWYVDGIGPRMIAEAQSGADSEGFQVIEGIISVDATVAASNTVYLFVDWIEQSTIVKRKPFIDNVSARAVAPSASPTSSPSDGPSAFPSGAPSDLPSAKPSIPPSASPTQVPWTSPSVSPSGALSELPSAGPSFSPSAFPTKAPATGPSESPSEAQSAVLSVEPSISPSASPALIPSADPVAAPSVLPSAKPSADPSSAPTATPSTVPSESEPCGVEYVLWNGNTNLPVEMLQSQFCLPDFKANIQVLTTENCPATRSARMTLSGPITYSRLENYEPFMLFGDKYKQSFHDIYGRTLLVGQYTIHSDLYERKSLNGNLAVLGSMEFEVVECDT